MQGGLLMEQGWELLLKELGLTDEVRRNAKLVVLEQFDSYDYFPLNKVPDLVQYIYELLGVENKFTLVETTKYIYLYETNEIQDYTEFLNNIISLDDISYLIERWEVGGGNYIIILPKEHIIDDEESCFGDEELIGHYLVLYKRLILKAPDGNALLYLYISSYQ
jgi:hypothetical protein